MLAHAMLLRDGRVASRQTGAASLPALRVAARGERLEARNQRRMVMSNSFAFGGSNASLIFSGS